MLTQEVWVHGNSGHVDKGVHESWFTEAHDSVGLFLEAKVQVQEQLPPPWLVVTTRQVSREVFVHFHVPTPTSEENLAELRKVMLRYSTDSNPGGRRPDIAQARPYVQTAYGFEYYVLDSGGAIVKELKVQDAESVIGDWPETWQSSSTTNYTVSSEIFDPPRRVHWGVGVTVLLLFKNQFFVEKHFFDLGKNPGADPAAQPYFPMAPDWDGKPWLNTAAATQTKHAYLSSVGCEFILARP